MGWNPEESIRSLKKLRSFRDKDGGFLAFGHDAKQWATMKRAPEYYD